MNLHVFSVSIFKKSMAVLMYHHINKNRDNLVTISPDDFEMQIQFLARRNYNTVFISDVVDFINGVKTDFSANSIALTFDDGFLDNWVYAYPILRRYNVKATIFAVTSWVSKEKGCRPNLDSVSSESELPDIPSHRDSKKMIKEASSEKVIMNWDELKCMQESGIIDIQSHMDIHADIMQMSKHSLKNSLNRSKELIEKRLRKSCDFLAWPWGEYNNNALTLAKEVGYKGILTVERGINFIGTDPYAIKRIVVKKGNIDWFSRRLFIYSNSLLGSVYSKIRR